MLNKPDNNTIEEMLEGAYDLHVHSSPSHVQRVEDDIQVYHNAARYHMNGVMYKCHYEPTEARAELVNRHFGQDGTRAFGSIVLNWPVGGLNPYAVNSALKLGARMIWMPTRDSARSLEFGDMPGDFFQRPGITVLDESGNLLPAVFTILEVARQYSVPVATGHLSVKESVALCEAGAALGNKMVLTHPEWNRTTTPLDVQIRLAEKGVKIEKCWINVIEGDTTEAYMLNTIRQLGPEAVFISTDSGKLSIPNQISNYKAAVAALVGGGFSRDDIRCMCNVIPELLISD